MQEELYQRGKVSAATTVHVNTGAKGSRAGTMRNMSRDPRTTSSDGILLQIPKCSRSERQRYELQYHIQQFQ
jgi:hypothetical protein